MRSGIVIRLGAENVDIVDVSRETLEKWWNTLDDAAKLRTVLTLCDTLDAA